MFSRIAHVCLGTGNLEASIAFYKKLGCRVVFMFTRNGCNYGAYLEIAPKQYIEIFEDTVLGNVVNNGSTHFCLETENIDHVIQKLSEEGVVCTAKKQGCDNTWQIWITDPDGNRFEVHQYTAKSAQITADGPLEADW